MSIKLHRALFNDERLVFEMYFVKNSIVVLWHLQYMVSDPRFHHVRKHGGFFYKVATSSLRQCFNTLRPRQMDAISQKTFSNAFSSMKMFEFRLHFH